MPTAKGYNAGTDIGSVLLRAEDKGKDSLQSAYRKIIFHIIKVFCIFVLTCYTTICVCPKMYNCILKRLFLLCLNCTLLF